METIKITDKLKQLNLKKIDLVKYLPISRSCLYIYMNYYDQGKFSDIKDKNILKLFDFIINESTKNKNDVIKYMLDNFESDSVKNYQELIFNENKYGEDRNIALLQANLKLLRNAAGWKKMSELSDETGISEDRLNKIESKQNKISKTEAIAIFTCLCRKSRESEEDDYLPIALSLIFDDKLLEEEKEVREIGLNYLSAVIASKNPVKKEDFKKNFHDYTNLTIGAGIILGATAIVIGSLALKIFGAKK